MLSETEFTNWQSPTELFHRSKEYISTVGNEVFLSTGEDEKTVQEATHSFHFFKVSRSYCR